MFWQCSCNHKISTLVPGNNCEIELEPMHMPMSVLKGKGIDHLHKYVFSENIPVMCKRCGRKMKFFLDISDDE